MVKREGRERDECQGSVGKREEGEERRTFVSVVTEKSLVFFCLNFLHSFI